MPKRPRPPASASPQCLVSQRRSSRICPKISQASLEEFIYLKNNIFFYPSNREDVHPLLESTPCQHRMARAVMPVDDGITAHRAQSRSTDQRHRRTVATWITTQSRPALLRQKTCPRSCTSRQRRFPWFGRKKQARTRPTRARPQLRCWTRCSLRRHCASSDSRVKALLPSPWRKWRSVRFWLFRDPCVGSRCVAAKFAWRAASGRKSTIRSVQGTRGGEKWTDIRRLQTARQ